MPVYAQCPEVDALMAELIESTKQQGAAVERFNQYCSDGGRDPATTSALMADTVVAGKRSVAAFEALQKFRID